MQRRSYILIIIMLFRMFNMQPGSNRKCRRYLISRPNLHKICRLRIVSYLKTQVIYLNRIATYPRIEYLKIGKIEVLALTVIVHHHSKNSNLSLF
jgi:hypothetical protein